MRNMNDINYLLLKSVLVIRAVTNKYVNTFSNSLKRKNIDVAFANGANLAYLARLIIVGREWVWSFVFFFFFLFVLPTSTINEWDPRSASSIEFSLRTRTVMRANDKSRTFSERLWEWTSRMNSTWNVFLSAVPRHFRRSPPTNARCLIEIHIEDLCEERCARIRCTSYRMYSMYRACMFVQSHLRHPGVGSRRKANTRPSGSLLSFLLSLSLCSLARFIKISRRQTRRSRRTVCYATSAPTPALI